MGILLASLVATLLVAPTESRSFWRLEEGPRVQPVQSLVAADLVSEGEHLLVYRERGYRFSTLGEEDEQRQIATAVRTFDEVVFPTLVPLFGPCPDRDANGKVILLLSRFNRDTALFFPFDQMSDEEARRHGFRSNQGEILYHSFNQQGNHSPRNVASLAVSMGQLLLHARDSQETAWSELLANYSQFLTGLARPRALWGAGRVLLSHPNPTAPLAPTGWSLLFIHYIWEQLGHDILPELAASPEQGFRALSAAIESRGASRTAADFLADFAMACQIDDPHLSNGRFAFSTVAPPQPGFVAHLPASRPTSGQVSCGIGGAASILVEGDGERPLPLALQGDPRLRWVARAVHLRRRGPDRELPIAFHSSGLARVDLPLLPAGDGVVITVVPIPEEEAELDPGSVPLHWGLGWIPRLAQDAVEETLLLLTEEHLPTRGPVLTRQLSETLELLSGVSSPSSSPPVTTRYAWAPQAQDTVAALREEARRRGLAPSANVFLRSTPQGAQQEWQNILIELPGSDQRRWPVVLAAHWDAARPALLDSYLRALEVDDNASGVAVALEVAAAVHEQDHHSPVIVALLAGGLHDAAGAQALLERLQGRVAAWIELDVVGSPRRPPRELAVTLMAENGTVSFADTITLALRSVGLPAQIVAGTGFLHTGVALAAMREIPAVAVTLEHPDDPEGLQGRTPRAELEEISPELMALLTRALTTTVLQLAGSSRPEGRSRR